MKPIIVNELLCPACNGDGILAEKTASVDCFRQVFRGKVFYVCNRCGGTGLITEDNFGANNESEEGE